MLRQIFLTAGAAIGVIYFFGGQEQPTETVSKPEKADAEQAEKDYQVLQGEVVEKSQDPYESKINFEELQKLNQRCLCMDTDTGYKHRLSDSADSGGR